MSKHTVAPWDYTTGLIQGPQGIDTAIMTVADDHIEANLRLIAEAPELYTEFYAELEAIVEAWELIEAGKIRDRKLTPWERERLGIIRDLLDKIDD